MSAVLPMEVRKAASSLPPKPSSPRPRGGSPDARKAAATILDVLAGQHTPTSAAEALGISVPRYYALEARAVEGMVKACEPRPKGRVTAPEKELALLRREVETLRREVERRQALVRAAQRAVGLSQPPGRPSKRKKRPAVRALKTARVLRSEPQPSSPQLEESLKET
jgi:hypothetical protein